MFSCNFIIGNSLKDGCLIKSIVKLHLVGDQVPICFHFVIRNTISMRLVGCTDAELILWSVLSLEVCITDFLPKAVRFWSGFASKSPFSFMLFVCMTPLESSSQGLLI